MSKTHKREAGGDKYGKGVCGLHGVVTRDNKKVNCKLCKKMIKSGLG